MADASGDTAQRGIGWAVDQLRAGHRVARASWSGQTTWLIFVRDYGVNIDANAVTERHQITGLVPWIGKRIGKGKFAPWFASQEDIMATDWEAID